MHIDLVMTYMSKKAFSQEDYSVFYEQVKSFDSVEKARKYLKNEFFYCKTRKPMYLDKTDGTYIQNGQIYCYNEKEYGRDGKNYYRNIQVWVAWYEVQAKAIDFTAISKKSRGFQKDFNTVYNETRKVYREQ
jgi:hypothetical protein